MQRLVESLILSKNPLYPCLTYLQLGLLSHYHCLYSLHGSSEPSTGSSLWVPASSFNQVRSNPFSVALCQAMRKYLNHNSSLSEKSSMSVKAIPYGKNILSQLLQLLLACLQQSPVPGGYLPASLYFPQNS